MKTTSYPVKTKHPFIIAAVLLAFVVLLSSAAIASAHEKRTVGKYDMIVGFFTEPAYTGLPNSLDLRVNETQSGKPVDGLEKTLKAEVIYGGVTMPLQLSAHFGQSGAYTASLVPTRAGSYSFHITGDIQGQAVDEKFQSGPETFDDVVDISTLDFPEKAPSPLDVAAQIKAAQNAAAAAQTSAYLGISIGVLGLIVGGISLLRRK